MNNVITFDAEFKEKILEAFGKTTDQEGYVVEKNNSAQRILTPDGEPLLSKDFVGIRKGSLVFIKSDINSLIDLSDITRE
jgi:hypothetical protein